ncbi:hypothetical protein BKA56DRAFT_638335 [Ilyonectria sp. MPI-CAGE-AT-0026]|nr:hypothetical protein BKA56DRAFT_638335 [Ilyonectria sp. MPI-CAGE-AT-0026]
MGPNDADPLAEDLGDRAASLLPKEILGIDTRTFAYKVEQPESNPDLTVWALINALKGSTTKGQSAVDSTKTVRELRVRVKSSNKSLEDTPYTLNFASRQNCDAMLRHLYGDEREDTERCLKCTKRNGALIGCVVSETNPACANCDWNRSGAACSFTSKKRKASEADDDDSDDTDPFEGIDRKTCARLAQIFKEAADRKKRKKHTISKAD